MTKIRLQDNSTEEDDDAGASEHYRGILPVSDSIASDPDYDFNPVSLHGTILDLYGEEASSEAKEDNLWSHYSSASTERSGMDRFDHPWTDIPMASQEKTLPVPKNMFGRTVEQVLSSPILPKFEPLPSLIRYRYNRLGPSTIGLADRRQSDHHQSPFLDAGIEEVRRNLDDGLRLAGNSQSTTATITSTPFSVPGQGLHSADPSTNLAEPVNQEGIAEGPITGRALPFVPISSIDGSASPPQTYSSPPGDTSPLNHLSTGQNQASMVNATSPNPSNTVVERQLEDSATIGVDGLSPQRFSSVSLEDEASGSDRDEQRKTFRHPGRKSDKKKTQKLYRCPDAWCGATFTRANDVERHRRNAAVHRQANKDTSTCCRKCGEELSRPDARRRHELKDSCGKRKINRKPPHPLAST